MDILLQLHSVSSYSKHPFNALIHKEINVFFLYREVIDTSFLY